MMVSKRRKVGAGVVISAALAGSAATPQPVTAMTPDNTGHWLCRLGSNSNLITGYNWGYDQLQTLPLWGPNIHNYDCGDVKVYSGVYGTSWIGNTDCLEWSWIHWGECNVMRVRVDEQKAGTDLTKWKSVSCHELGHTVDLPHNGRASSCMDSTIGSYPLSFDSGDDNAAITSFLAASL